MIGNTLKRLVVGLNDYLRDIYTTTTEYAFLKQASEDMFANTNEKIVVTLVNMEEDTVFKNHLAPFQSPNPNLTHPLGGKPVIRFNLFILIVCDPGSDDLSYLDALTMLSHVVRYFKTNPAQQLTVMDGNVSKTVNLEIDFHNISLEDSNNMWSNFGGKQLPFAMYRLSLLEIESDDPDISNLNATITNPRIKDPSTGDENVIQL
jgi:hypothetical protein